ncbi:MAG: hypothetical protein A2756_05030 [Candidatus Ryanbacteria bacterium RIFCSPHIGHO2_01_FULL_48_27]|uniref:Helicase/UvrB N-terminal domain-containing protein n=1 Tax=Candidatus Ryanbacteria bacterium RIFCSPHIGHO2_01_FULL_48_27 TaxID=1802115 RepID=A0A1G2G2A3_9BACT|nr:MAG: hypothetical protein A2756_05030 [Candidatus Ryanbacteria bacterium RIFCSPHIGHO2_01_FULL_48_27]
MELREFQKRAIRQVEAYLAEVKKQEKKAGQRHASLLAWDELKIKDFSGQKLRYHSKENPLEKDVPNFVLKVPTGGGKTILAVNTIGAINRVYKQRRTGLVLWVVPTDEIFKQTVRSLKNRNHAYRQHLDVASGGRTIVREKYKSRIDRFSPAEVGENLVVYVMMLQAAAANDIAQKERKIFEDSGGFEAFFPTEDRYDEHRALLQKFPNLNCFEEGGHRVAKTSLANTIRIFEPTVILDESQKAYTELGKKTILGFNPSIIVELSATPPQGSNPLVQITGKELNDEEMIKLDLHVHRYQGGGWHTVLKESVEKRHELEKAAKKHEKDTGVHIRPILLIQAERVGKDQRGSGHIHGDEVKEALIRMGVHESEIAIKTSEKDELKQYEAIGGLMARACEVRYIITKHALQEGWDCPFAYTLTVLARSTAHNALKQLVGRVLRQPYAKKTGVAALDESYVYVYHDNSREVLEAISDSFKNEGLVDIAGRVRIDDPETGGRASVRSYPIQKQFARTAKVMMLPFFFSKEGSKWRRTNYERDVLASIAWPALVKDCVIDIALQKKPMRSSSITIGISADGKDTVSTKDTNALAGAVETQCTPVMMADALRDAIPNPWLAYEIAEREWKKLESRFDAKTVGANTDFILEELRKKAGKLLEVYARKVFERKVELGRIGLIVAQKDGWKFPETIDVPVRGNTEYQLSLFERIPNTDLNGLEFRVAEFLDEQERLYFWYRNMARKDYAIQGWRRERIFADFIFTLKEGKAPGKVYVLETKGEHLAGNLDTVYKKDVLDLCTKYAKKASKTKLKAVVGAKSIEYELVPQDTWRTRLTEIFA